MELVWIIYLIEVITNIKMWGLSDFIGMFVLGNILLGCIVFFYCILEEDYTILVKYRDFVLRKIVIIPLLLVFGFGSLFNALMPSKETVYLMLGAYGVQSVAETVGKSEDMQRIGKQTLKLVESTIEKYQKELEVVSEKQVDSN